MGDYADDAFERDLAGACYDYDHGDYNAFNGRIPIYSSNNSTVENNLDYIHLDCSILTKEDDWLLRKGTEYTDKLNKLVVIKQITEKAILFEFVEEWTNTLHWEMKGKQFWLPKSILYKHKDHKKVIYVPKWTKIKIINVN